MIPHHQQAIQLSDMLFAKQGIDPRVIDLAQQFKAAQGPEIDQMQGWLKQWDMPGMPGMGDMPGMDGLMSPADMQALQGAQGVDASKLYLTQMSSTIRAQSPWRRTKSRTANSPTLLRWPSRSRPASRSKSTHAPDPEHPVGNATTQTHTAVMRHDCAACPGGD
jgi:hypothetical protein